MYIYVNVVVMVNSILPPWATIKYKQAGGITIHAGIIIFILPKIFIKKLVGSGITTFKSFFSLHLQKIFS